MQSWLGTTAGGRPLGSVDKTALSGRCEFSVSCSMSVPLRPSRGPSITQVFSLFLLSLHFLWLPIPKHTEYPYLARTKSLPKAISASFSLWPNILIRLNLRPPLLLLLEYQPLFFPYSAPQSKRTIIVQWN